MAESMTAAVQNDAFTNPYEARVDADRHALWDILIARDSDAFIAADWSVCDDDFAHGRFEGLSANGAIDPTQWTLRYPTVESYRDDWLQMADQFRAMPLVAIPHRELLYRMQSFAKVEIANGRAIVWKQFWADEPLTNGERYQISAQSVYRLQRIVGAWKIVGFIGYLPMESRAV
jgi:hypothetical protein